MGYIYSRGNEMKKIEFMFGNQSETILFSGGKAVDWIEPYVISVCASCNSECARTSSSSISARILANAMSEIESERYAEYLSDSSYVLLTSAMKDLLNACYRRNGDYPQYPVIAYSSDIGVGDAVNLALSKGKSSSDIAIMLLVEDKDQYMIL